MGFGIVFLRCISILGSSIAAVGLTRGPMSCMGAAMATRGPIPFCCSLGAVPPHRTGVSTPSAALCWSFPSPSSRTCRQPVRILNTTHLPLHSSCCKTFLKKTAPMDLGCELSVERRIGSVGLGFGLRSFSAPNPTFPTPRSVRSAPRSCAGCSSVTVFGIRVLEQLRAVLSIVQQRSERSARANNCQELKAVLRLCSRAGICASRVPTCAKAAKGVLERRAVVAMPSCIGAVLCVRWQPWGCAPCGRSSGLCPVWGAIPAAVTAVGF